MNFFNKEKKPNIVSKNTTFSYERKTPEKIIEEREMKKTNELFSKINHNNNTVQLNNKNINFNKNKFKI